ncbi:unnamed protein product [Oncorhynchus mykiss]|uniref:DUF4585 domain-containing protein n=1 Tax=Oncorhynchus mykiss TaxID=8022 RepID=A0A060X4L7_ONCMY|nr:unnamed protein product [Oncorhynchus mykiss]
MTCVEKCQHVSHRSTMLHHRFPNGFTEIFMDETDREVSTLTDRAFRSLCIGDEAAYNDEFSYGYPFSCHKPLVEEPLKRTKDTGKKHQINGTIGTQPWKQQKSMSSLTLLKAFSATEEKCEGMLIKNWDFKDTNGDSWDKSALLSIERELSEFSSDYNNLIAKKSGKGAKFSKTKNCISNFKLRKLHIKNCFLHSEFSPFQSWRDFNHSPFGQEDITSIPHVVNNLPKWYDSPLYKELTEAHRIETLRAEEMEQQCQKPVEPPPPPRHPPKVLPKPSAPEKRCASDTSSQGETSTPWRRNRVRVKSAVPVNQSGLLCTPTETPKLVEESNIPYKKKVKSIKVKEVEEPCSLTSTPFSISQLMTPIIPSRQATDTSEILSAVLSPSLLDLTRLDLEHVSPVKSRSTPEVIKRESYKSIASSLLFNLKDNRKRVKSRYSPPKFKTEQADRRTLSPKLLEQRLLKYAQAPSDVTASGFNGLPICSPDVSESSNAGLRKYLDSDISDDYLISKLLQTKREAAASRSPGPRTKKQMYPTLNLYNSLVEPEMKHFSPSMNKATLSITTPNKGLSRNMSDNTKDHPTTQKDGISLNISEKPVKEMSEQKEKGVGGQPVHTSTNREALPTAQNKVLSPNRTDNAKQPTKDTVEFKEKHNDEQTAKKEKEPVKEQGRFKHIFSARQNNYIKSQRYALMENGEEEQEEEDLEPKMEVNNKKDMDKEVQDAERSVHKEMKDGENIISDLHALKELEKARLGGRHSKDGENLKPKPMIDGEAKAKNDLISRELRNIKRGILSMRGNTFAKKEAFANKEKEQARRDVFSTIDNNVVVNKSLINDNYDKAKMALEEIISDRAEKRKNQVFSNKECENNRVPDENPDDSYNVRVQKSRPARQDYIRKATEGKQNEVRGRLGDLKDHHQIQGIISQTETKLGENHRFGATIYTEQNKLATRYIREEQVQGNTINNVSDKQKHNIRSSKYPAEESDRTVAKQLSVETRDDTSRNDEVVTEESQPDAPVIKPKVPPRSKKGSIKKEDSSEKEKECANVMDIIEEGTKNKDFSIREYKNDNILRKENTHARGKVSSKEALDAKIKADQQTDALETEKTAEQEKRFVQNKHHVGLPGEYSKYPHEANTCFSPSEEKEKEMKALLNERKTNTLPRKKLKAEKIQHNIEQQEQLCVRRKAPLKPDKDHSKPSNQVNTSTEDESIMKKDSMKKIQATDESDKSVRVCEDIVHVDEVLDQDIRETLVSPLSNGSSINPGQQNQTSMSPKSSYFFVENTLQRNLETDSNIYHSLENLTAKFEEVEEGVKNGPERVRGDLERRTEVEYYSVSDHENEDVEDKPVVPREMDKRGWFQSPMDNTNNQMPTSQPNVSSPHNRKGQRAPWSPRESLSGSERGEEDHLEIPELHAATITTDKHLKPRETASHHSPLTPLSPSKLTPENSQRGQQYGSFLTVTQEYNKHSSLSPSSETSTMDTADDTPEVYKVPSERSGSVCRANDTQGPGRPPVVPPKSEKALFKAMKLTTRRIQKEEKESQPQKSSTKSCSSRSDKNKRDKSSEQKSSSSDSSEKHHTRGKQHQERTEHSSRSSEKHSRESQARNSEKHHDGVPEHQSHSSEKSWQERTEPSSRGSEEHRHGESTRQECSSDNQRHVGSERQSRNRDKQCCGKSECHRSEKHSRDKPEQRFRSSDRAVKHRNHSVDSYASDVIDLTSPHPNLSRQSSYTSQFSRQSSIEHRYASFPMTQRKLLQDPDSGQYFVVDMPVQVKTKTFFDPETGNYVQLPIQPPEGPTMEVMNAPMVLYQGSFVPVPVSSIPSQKSTVHPSQLDQEDFERMRERQRYKHNGEGHPYLEPVYGSQDHMLGEFLGTEDLYDCVN